MSFLISVVGFILALLTPLASLVLTDPAVMFDDEIQIVENKTGGFIRGVCHPDDNFELIKDANIEWIREDLPLPVNADGSSNIHYENWKREASQFAENGIRIMAITPYPDDYIEIGLDPRVPENEAKIKEIAQFYVNDLKDVVGAFQITNEMGVDRFTYPLTMEEAARFIGIQLEAMQPVKGNIITGYNLTAQGLLELPGLMKPWHQYCDYVGLDLYLGCFEGFTKSIEQNIVALKYVRRVTGKPVIMCEFGYIGLGEPKTDKERIAVLEKYGYSSEEEAIADIDNFIAKLPGSIPVEFEQYKEESVDFRAQLLFNGEYRNHIYCELPEGYGLYGYEHTPEGQAKFYEYMLAKAADLDFVVGSFIYCWQDSGACYICDQEECPVETKWGLIDYAGNPKQAYYAVQNGYGKIRGKVK